MNIGLTKKIIDDYGNDEIYDLVKIRWMRIEVFIGNLTTA